MPDRYMMTIGGVSDRPESARKIHRHKVSKGAYLLFKDLKPVVDWLELNGESDLKNIVVFLQGTHDNPNIVPLPEDYPPPHA